MTTITIKQYNSVEEPITVQITDVVGDLDSAYACTHMGAMDWVDYDNVKNGFMLDGHYECDKCGAINEWGEWEHGLDDLNLEFWGNNLVVEDYDDDNGDFEYDQWRDSNGL